MFAFVSSHECRTWLNLMEGLRDIEMCLEDFFRAWASGLGSVDASSGLGIQDLKNLILQNLDLDVLN